MMMGCRENERFTAIFLRINMQPMGLYQLVDIKYERVGLWNKRNSIQMDNVRSGLTLPSLPWSTYVRKTVCPDIM